jgi:hypothetical protein
MITVVLVVSLGVIAGAYLGLHFGRLQEGERFARVLDRLLAEAREREAQYRRLLVQVQTLEALQEITRRQCRACLRDVADCSCPMAAHRGRA